MADEAAPAPQDGPAKPPETIVRQVALPVIYFNNVRAYATDFDLSLDLGLAAVQGEPADVAVRAVTSWEHARRLRDLLDRLITRYEEAVGPTRNVGRIGEPEDSA